MSKIRLTALPRELRKIINMIYKNYSEEELMRVIDAYEYAKLYHGSQKRKSGEPYIIHPLNVALILAELNLDIISIQAGLLHDVAEDTTASLQDIEDYFGKDVAKIVDGVTKIEKLNIAQSSLDKKAETVRKMFLAMAEDIRVILVKLADRLHNLRTMDSMPENKQKEKAKETLQIYAPLAHRLGIHAIKWQLEDLAFKYLYPEEYKKIAAIVDRKRIDREFISEEYKSMLQLTLSRHGINFEISGRQKHFYSIWRKMDNFFKPIDEIYDMIALRVITSTEKECYYVMGLVHNLWKPIPGRVKDYIATPKSNGYRSLHTSVITHRGEALEIQIRSKEMHQEAEFGLAAHWIYKEGKISKYQQDWLERLKEWHMDYKQGISGLVEFQKELGIEDVYIFTPKGEVKHMPKGSTTIDFAYSVHTEIGHHFAGAKVNGNIESLDYELKNGDMVEIIVNKNSNGPSRDWLKYAKSSSTRAKIKRFFREKYNIELQEKGKEILRQASKKLQISMEEISSSPEFVALISKDNILKPKDILLKLGEGEYSAEDIVALFDVKEEEEEKIEDIPVKKSKRPKNTVMVNGQSGIFVKIAKCCSPVPGDPIIGVLSPKGITVHIQNCPNVKNIVQGEMVEVNWGDTTSETYPVSILLETNDASGSVLKEILKRAKDKSVKIDEVNTKFNGWDNLTYRIRIYVRSSSQLLEIIENWGKINGVLRTYRVGEN